MRRRGTILTGGLGEYEVDPRRETILTGGRGGSTGHRRRGTLLTSGLGIEDSVGPESDRKIRCRELARELRYARTDVESYRKNLAKCLNKRYELQRRLEHKREELRNPTVREPSETPPTTIPARRRRGRRGMIDRLHTAITRPYGAQQIYRAMELRNEIEAIERKLMDHVDHTRFLEQQIEKSKAAVHALSAQITGLRC